jgi:GGDEF domain-containing protein
MPALEDARAEDAIDAFIAGPEARRGRRRGTKRTLQGGDPPNHLESRIAWNEALERESARTERYRRPASVVVIRAQQRSEADDELSVTRLAQPIGYMIRRGARETDVVTRASDGRFQILLPETSEEEAAQFAERIIADCDVWIRAMRTPVLLRAAAAAASAESTLEAALERAIRAVEGE